MITYKECENAISSFPAYPEKEYVWFAYKNGESKQFSSRKDALTFSENVERTELNPEDYKEKLKLYHADQQKVINYWIAEMRKEFGVPDNIFDICYSEAYDRGHSYGYDEVYSYMIDSVAFAEKVVTAAIENIAGRIVDAAGY